MTEEHVIAIPKGVVAYRNPLEQWLWESGLAWWFVTAAIGCVALIFLLWGALGVLDWYINRERKRRALARTRETRA